MTIELTQEQHKTLQETRILDTPAEFETMLSAARPEMDRVVREVQAPSQPITTTLVELRDLYLSVREHTPALTAVGYDDKRRGFFRDAIRLLDTARLWFGEGHRTGAYRVRPVVEVVEASRPWRARLAAYANQAFAFEPETAERFADVNSTGTLEEEIADLVELVGLAHAHEDALAAVGMPKAFLEQGEALRSEAEGRDLIGILGLRNQKDAISLRNRILTYAVKLGREVRAAGINGCWEDEEAKRRFEAASFRDALRHLKPRRRGGKEDTSAPETEASANGPISKAS